MIWERAPKTTYCGYEKLEFVVYDACAHFNYGRQATTLIFFYKHNDYKHI